MAAAVLVLPALLLADPPDLSIVTSDAPTVTSTKTDSGPSTRPARGDTGGGGGGAVGGGVVGGGGAGGFAGEGRLRPGPAGRQFFQEEASAAIEFFTKNSPNRMKYFNDLPSEAPLRRIETGNLVQLYRPLQNFRETNPDLYKLLVQQVALRDQAFALAHDGKEAELASLVAQQIVPISLQARSMRLELLERELAEQQSKLADDKAHPDLQARTEEARIKTDEVRLVKRAEQHRTGQLHGQSMLNFDTMTDPLTDVAPIFGNPQQPGDETPGGQPIGG